MKNVKNSDIITIAFLSAASVGILFCSWDAPGNKGFVLRAIGGLVLGCAVSLATRLG